MKKDFCSSCGSKDLKFVRYIIASGRTNIRQQCFNCGSLFTHNFKFSLFEDIKKLPLWDAEKRTEFYNQNIERRDKKQEYYQKGLSYYKDEYLKSDEWREKRKIILERDQNKCRCCGENANDIHHITYDRAYREKDTDLIAVCRSCHNKIHKNGTVFFQGLKANFGVLKNCQHCNKYHNDFTNLCKSCTSTETHKNIGSFSLKQIAIKRGIFNNFEGEVFENKNNEDNV